MSIQAVAWALDQDLPARPKLVLVSIANHANHTDGYCWLKAETIAQEASCSPRAVFNFVGDLIRNGFVRKSPRKGDDGKQRANDYWILMNRPAETPWISKSEAETDDAEGSADDEAEAQDVAQPDAPRACGEDVENPPANPVDMPVGAYGPHAPACSRRDSAEPSKTNPENAPARASTPRHYRPPPVPPPQPMGSTTVDGSGPMIFVFVGTPAYDAWCERKSRDLGRKWRQQTAKNGRFGWYFPTLFPQAPPETQQVADQENPFEKAG